MACKNAVSWKAFQMLSNSYAGFLKRCYKYSKWCLPAETEAEQKSTLALLFRCNTKEWSLLLSPRVLERQVNRCRRRHEPCGDSQKRTHGTCNVSRLHWKKGKENKTMTGSNISHTFTWVTHRLRGDTCTALQQRRCPHLQCLYVPTVTEKAEQGRKNYSYTQSSAQAKSITFLLKNSFGASSANIKVAHVQKVRQKNIFSMMGKGKNMATDEKRLYETSTSFHR